MENLDKKLLPLLIIIVFLLIIHIIIPIDVKGVVEFKAINGRMSENIVDGILFNSLYPNGSWIQVENEDFEQFFNVEDKNVFINDSLHELMEKKYVNIDYIIAIKVSSKDSINDVKEGKTFAYLVDREGFNKVKIGDKVVFKVSRFNIATIEDISVL